MIYTVTFNPALDYIVTVDHMEMGMTNRTSSELMMPGGKGVNVSILLSNLGIENTALGFVAGFTGDEICRRLEESSIATKFVRIHEGNSRINVKIKNIDGMEINGAGPDIPPEKVEELMTMLDRLTEDDCLVLAGSIPASMSKDIYRQIMSRLQKKGTTVIVDATKELLTNVLQYRPFLIKPNNHELGELFGVSIKERSQVPEYARKLQEMGARNVLVSMGGKGAVLVTENGEAYEADAPEGKLVNAVGAGDSMVAGFLAGWIQRGAYDHAFQMGLASGSASAFSDYLATEEEIAQVYARCSIRLIKDN